MPRFGGLPSVWDNLIVSERLAHYWQILQQQAIPYCILCKRIPCRLESVALEEKWELHKIMKEEFEDVISNEAKLKRIIENPLLPTFSFLDLKILLAKQMILSCEMCENLCRIDRSHAKGICGIGEDAYISSSFLHTGEEPPLIPSGTIFFMGCNFDCCFCQNADISTAGKRIPVQLNGDRATSKELAKIADKLAHESALNINYVGGDPIPNLAMILESMKWQTMPIAQLWNSNFYNTIPTLELLKDVIDIWLPDFKYGNNKCAKIFSRINRYWDIITRNLTYIYSHSSRSIIIRHLVLPGHVECCSIPILQWIHDHIPKVLVNIMGQYHPENRVSSSAFAEINRSPSQVEMQRVFEFAENLNIEYRSVS